MTKKQSSEISELCAQDWIRTSTPFPALPPQGSASTSFATWAGEPQNYEKLISYRSTYFGSMILKHVPLPISELFTAR